MNTNLPLDVVRSFVAIVETGSMLKASERVFLTQSALSLQVRRLEEMLQTQVFHREGRRLTLTPAGETLLGYARRLLALNDDAVRVVSGVNLDGPLRIGMVQDYAETLLSGVLAQFARLHPGAPIQARVGGTLELQELLAENGLDLVLGYADPGTASELRRDPIAWIGDPALVDQEVLPLAVLEKPCRFREAALRALDASGRPYRLALETPNLATLRAGVEAGLGLTCRTPWFQSSLREPAFAPPHHNLPELPEVSTVLWTRAAAPDSLGRISLLLSQVVSCRSLDAQAAEREEDVRQSVLQC